MKILLYKSRIFKKITVFFFFFFQGILSAGSILQENADFDNALLKYRVGAVFTPNSPELWSNIGMCFFGKGKYVAVSNVVKISILLICCEFRFREWIRSFFHANRLQY